MQRASVLPLMLAAIAILAVAVALSPQPSPGGVTINTTPDPTPTVQPLPRQAHLTAGTSGTIIAASSQAVLSNLLRSRDTAAIDRAISGHEREVFFLFAGQPVTLQGLSTVDGWRMARVRLSTGAEVWTLASSVE